MDLCLTGGGYRAVVLQADSLLDAMQAKEKLGLSPETH